MPRPPTDGTPNAKRDLSVSPTPPRPAAGVTATSNTVPASRPAPTRPPRAKG
jgi:hypothetical protein